jgi:hypothetical protein
MRKTFLIQKEIIAEVLKIVDSVMAHIPEE